TGQEKCCNRDLVKSTIRHRRWVAHLRQINQPGYRKLSLLACWCHASLRLTSNDRSSRRRRGSGHLKRRWAWMSRQAPAVANALVTERDGLLMFLASRLEFYALAFSGRRQWPTIGLALFDANLLNRRQPDEDDKYRRQHN